MGTIEVHANGKTIPISWISKEQAVSELVQHGILDDGSADFLMKASDSQVKDIMSSLGPDVRNPSAFVTRRCKEMQGGGKGGHVRREAVPTLTVFALGADHVIEWPNC